MPESSSRFVVWFFDTFGKKNLGFQKLKANSFGRHFSELVFVREQPSDCFWVGHREMSQLIYICITPPPQKKKKMPDYFVDTSVTWAYSRITWKRYVDQNLFNYIPSNILKIQPLVSNYFQKIFDPDDTC